MSNYTVTHYLSHSVRVSVTYSANPFFPGEICEALVTFEHIDPKKHVKLQEEEHEREEEQEHGQEQDPEQGNEENTENWTSRISSQFSRSLFFSQLQESELSLIDQQSTTETFLSASLQIFGHFQVDDEVIDLEKFSKLRQSSLVSGCIGGVPALKVSQNAPKSFLQSFTSNLSSILTSDIGEVDLVMSNGFHVNKDLVHSVNPVFSTKQFLMFPSLTLGPGDVKQYYLRIPLPSTIPPTYHSENISVSYELILNTEKFLTSHSVPTNMSLTFPLKISIGPKSDGLQVVPSLHNEFYFNKKYLKSTMSKTAMLVELNKQYDDFSFVPDLLAKENKGFPRISETPELVQMQRPQGALKSEFISTMKTLINEKSLTTSEQIRSLPTSPILNNPVTPNIDSITGRSDQKGNVEEASPREEIGHFVSTFSQSKYGPRFGFPTGFGNHSQAKLDENHSYEPVISNNQIRTSFLVKFKNRFTTKLVFDKPFYRVGESINLCFDFVNSDPTFKSFTTSGISISLESFEKFDYGYLQEYQKPLEEIYDHFQKDPKTAYSNWKIPLSEDSETYIKYTEEDINESPEIEREIIAGNPEYWKKFTHIHWVKKYSLLSSSQRKFNVNDMFLNYSLVPQFATDVFKLRYYLSFKFILVDDNDDSKNSTFLSSVQNDSNGEAYCAKDVIHGSVFNIKLPINIIASDADFGSISV